MSAKFYTLLTEIGAAKLASAAALGVPLKITQMAVGDGGGVLPAPSAQQTKLVAEKRRADLNMLYIDPQNSSQMIAEQVIPETEGGWWIREVGLFDETGALIAVGNCPESYKPQLAEGSGRTQTVRMVLITSSTDNITLKIDPSVVLATRKYVDDKVLELKVYVDDLMAKHLAAADPHSQYAQKNSPTLTGTPKTPTAPAGNNSTQIASTAFVQAALVALINGAPATLDTLKEIAAAINNDPAFSTTINNALGLKAPLASPALTGTPTAPTAAQTVNNTQIATTAFVKAALAALVNAAPGALDTLNELAAALGNDPNFATTMATQLGLKAPQNSPELTGTPKAPTAAAGTSTPQLATTEFVTRAVAPALLVRGGIPASSNINNFGPTSDYVGVWGQSSVSATAADIANGYPAAERGVLEVFSGGRNNGTQRYTTDGGRFFIRWLTAAWNAASPSWSEWIEVGGLSSSTVLPGSVTTLSDAAYFAQNQTYVLSGTRTDSPVGLTAGQNNAIIMSMRRAGGTIMGLHQTLFTAVGTYERYGAPNAATGWSSVTWYPGGDANGWRLMGADAMAAIGLGLASQTATAAFDWQQADFVAGQNYLVNVTGWLNAPAGMKNPAGDVVNIQCVLARSDANRFVVRVTSQSTTSMYKYDYTVVIANAKGNRAFTVTQNYNSEATTVIPLANGGLGSTTPEGGRKTLGFEDLGYGVAVQPVADPFDWQQAEFVSDQSKLATVGSWTNAPAGLNYSSNVVVIIKCVSTQANRLVLHVTSNAASSANRAEYNIIATGVKGSRIFTVTQVYNSDTSTVIPVANGGHGGKTPAEAQANLELVKQVNSQDGTAGRLMMVGGFGLGTKSPAKIALDNMNPGGFYVAPALLGGLDDNVAVVGIPYDANTGYQLLIPPIPTAAPKIYFRQQSTTPAQNGRLCMVYTDTNTTKAADGTLKAASPIVKLFADGSAETNEESEGCTATRLGVGEYLIQGCIGLNADAAWGGVDGGFDIPKDRNRQPLVWLDYEVNPDGSVLVKTYHRTFPESPAFARNLIGVKNEDGTITETVMNGDPIDIPADQFVSVRVEMPADSIYNQALKAAIEKAAIDAASEKGAREEAAREQAALEEAALEEAARQQAEREEAAQQQAANEEAARQQAALEEAMKLQEAEEAARQLAVFEKEARELAELEQSAAKQYPDTEEPGEEGL